MAVHEARKRLAGVAGVTVRELDLPSQYPDGPFDLVVVSEVGYFLSPAELDRLVARIAESLDPDGVVLLCHWRHPVAGWVLDGPEVHRRLREAWGRPVVHLERDFVLEVWQGDLVVTRTLTDLSVVLPPRNEAGRLGDCRASIAAAIAVYAANPGSLPVERGHRPGLLHRRLRQR